VLLGAELLSERMGDVERDIEEHEGVDPSPLETYDDTALDLLRYLSIGAVMRGERKLVQGIYGGLRSSARTTGWLAGKLSAATDNRLVRPFRRPVEAQMRRLEQTLDSYVREGRIEEQRSKRLAAAGVEEITDGAVEWVAHSPELNAMARDIIAGQGAGLAGAVRDNTRQATVTGDSVLERIVRRLLRMTPRDQLPPSPLEGQPQTMYAPDTLVQAEEDDG
jgi:hypothetical protein